MRLLVPKIRIRINRDKFCDSELFDLGTLGVHGRVKLEKIQIKGQKVAKQFIDIGASIHVCDGENYSKTKIIRFTNRFTIINRLGFPIQVRRTLQSDLNVLENNVPLCLDLFFITEFKSKSRNCFEKDTTDNYEDLQLRCYTQGSKDDKTPWSVWFCGENLGDFQIKVPKVAESEQPLLGEYIEREKKRVWYDLDNDYIVRVTIMNDPTFNEKIFIIIQKSLQPDYIFKNHLDKPIQLRQEFQDENTNPIIIEAAGASPIVIHTVINQPEYAAKNKQIILYINKDPNQKLIWNTAENLTSGTYYCQQQIAGNMRMLEIYDNKNEEGVKKAKNNEERKVEMIEQARIYAEENQSETKNDLLSDLVYDIKLAGIGFSLVDFKPQELCYIIFDQIHVSYKIFQTIIRKQTQKLEDLEISIRNFQIDAMQNEICPILLGPKDPFRNIERMFQHLQIEEAKDQDTKEKYKINQIQDKQPILQIQMKRYLEDDGDDITETIEQLEIELQPLEFKLHLSLVMEIQQLMNSLISLFNDLGTINSSELIKMVIETQEMMSDDPSKPKKEIRQDNNQCQKVNYIVQKMKTNINKNIMAKLALSKEFLDQPHPPKCLTVDYSSKPADLNIKKEKLFLENFKIRAVKCFMTLRIRGIESILQKSGPMGWLLNLVSNIADITEAEFNFTELEMQKLAQANTMITENLIQHYKHEAIQQFYQVFGSQDIIGNPSSFITNVSKGTDNFYNGPLGALLDNKPKEAAWGVVSSLAGILSNTGIAITNSYTGVSGSAYLGLRNICGAGLTHEDLDRPLTVGGGLKKGGIGFLQETKNGFEGIYFVPKNTVKTQGKAPLPLLKGIGQGILQFTLFPVNAFFRMSYDISTGTMQHLKGVKDHGQRYRYPRYFDQNERMEPYNHNHAHAQLALKIVNKGQFKKEVLQHVYDVSKYDKDEFKGFFRDRVIIITNKNILYIHNNRTLIEGVQLSEIKGMMFYFAKQEYNSVRMELKADRMVSMETKLPEKNKLIVKDLKDRLDDYQKHVENAETIKKKEVVERKENQNQLNKTLEAHQQDNLQNQQAAPVLFEDENGNQYELTWETLEDQDQQLLVQ